jgi:TolB protein
MQALRKALVAAVVVSTAAILSAVVAPGAASAANPGVNGDIAFVRAGNIFIAAPGHAATQATTGGSYAWPKWRPGGDGELAFVYQNNVWTGIIDFVTHQVDPEQQISFGGHAGAPSWSPDGSELAYIISPNGFNETMYIARLGSSGDFTTTSAAAVSSRDVGPARVSPASDTGAAWSALSKSFNLAWSPNGKSIAFPGGDCTGIYDACLSVVDLATNTERTIVAFGGGGIEVEGYATDPAWTADSKHLLWNQQTSGDDGTDPNTPLQVWQSSPTGANAAKIGLNGDSEPAPAPAGNGVRLVAGGHNHQLWVIKVTSNGTRTPLYFGSEADWGSATVV